MKVVPLFYSKEESPFAYKIENILDDFSCDLIHNYYLFNSILRIENEDPKVSRINDAKTHGIYCDNLGVVILQNLTDKVSEVLNKKVVPSYSYTRVYEKGTQLLPHRDRPGCEISMSITLKNVPDNTKNEKFYFAKSEEDSDPVVQYLNTGDAILFFGSEEDNGYYHWRDTTDSDYIMQVFLHWVYADGKHLNKSFEWTKLNEQDYTNK